MQGPVCRLQAAAGSSNSITAPVRTSNVLPSRCFTCSALVSKVAARPVTAAVAVTADRGPQPLQRVVGHGVPLEELRVVDLQQMLVRLGLPKSGTKASLLARLRGHLDTAADPANSASLPELHTSPVADTAPRAPSLPVPEHADSSRLSSHSHASTSNGSSQVEAEQQQVMRGRTKRAKLVNGSSASTTVHNDVNGGIAVDSGSKYESGLGDSTFSVMSSCDTAATHTDAAAGALGSHTAAGTVPQGTSADGPLTTVGTRANVMAPIPFLSTIGRRKAYLPLQKQDGLYRVSRSRRREAREAERDDDDEDEDNFRQLLEASAQDQMSDDAVLDELLTAASAVSSRSSTLHSTSDDHINGAQPQDGRTDRQSDSEQHRLGTAAAAGEGTTTNADTSPELPVPVSAMEGLTEADIPPFPVRWRGTSYMLFPAMVAPGNYIHLLNSNPAGLQLTFLGTASHRATPRRSLSSVVLCRGKDLFVFDSGDDTQRGVAHQWHVKPSKMYRIFLTSLTADCLLGLPGLLCCICASRLRGHEGSDIPIHVFGPPGVAEYLSVMFKVSNTFLEVPILVHEFSFKAVDELDTMPGLFNRRAKIWRALMPPDQLNPQGFIDGDLSRIMPTQGRATQRKGAKSAGGVLAYDPRAGYLAFPEPVPGDPERTDLSPSAATWTIQVDLAAQVVCKALRAPQPTMGYVYKEADRVGALSMDRCEALGVIPGDDFSMLKRGESVFNREGKVVDSTMVVAPDKPGRKIAILGSCLDASHAADVITGADVLVYGCGLSSDGGPTEDAPAEWVGDGGQPLDDAFTRGPASDAGRLAQSLGVRHLVLTKFDGRPIVTYTNPKGIEPMVNAHLAAAKQHLQNSTSVTAVKDNWTLVVDKHEGDQWAPPDVEVVPALSLIAQIEDPELKEQQRRENRARGPPRGGSRGGGRGGRRSSW